MADKALVSLLQSQRRQLNVLHRHVTHFNAHQSVLHTHHYPPHRLPQPFSTNKHKAYLCKWWQNGTRCRDGVKVLWCHSHLVWLVFEASIPKCTCFPSENFLWLVLWRTSAVVLLFACHGFAIHLPYFCLAIAIGRRMCLNKANL